MLTPEADPSPSRDRLREREMNVKKTARRAEDTIILQRATAIDVEAVSRNGRLAPGFPLRFTIRSKVFTRM